MVCYMCKTSTDIYNDVLANEILGQSKQKTPQNTACQSHRKMENHLCGLLIFIDLPRLIETLLLSLHFIFVIQEMTISAAAKSCTYGVYEESAESKLSLSGSVLWRAIPKWSMYNSTLSEVFAIQAADCKLKQQFIRYV